MKARNRKHIFSIGKTRHFLTKIPTAIWGAFAVLGILSFGVMLGYEIGVNTEIEDKTKGDYEQNIKLMGLISGYERLSDLYKLQGENVRIVFDEDLLYNHPEEVAEAFGSIEQYRNEILVQAGRIYELRRASGLPEVEQVHSN